MGMYRRMRLIKTLARPAVALPFVVTGLATLRDPAAKAEQVGPSVKPIADRLDWLPTKDPETLVKVQAAISVGAGTLFALGRMPRLSALLLAAEVLPAMLTEHQYWAEDDPQHRAEERSHFFKNAGLFGALLMLSTEHRKHPRAADLRRQARDARIKAGAELRHTKRDAARQVRDARRQARRGANRAAGAVRR